MSSDISNLLQRHRAPLDIAPAQQTAVLCCPATIQAAQRPLRRLGRCASAEAAAVRSPFVDLGSAKPLPAALAALVPVILPLAIVFSPYFPQLHPLVPPHVSHLRQGA